MSNRHIRQIDNATRMVNEVTIRFVEPLSLARKKMPLNKLIMIKARMMVMSILNMLGFNEIKMIRILS